MQHLHSTVMWASLLLSVLWVHAAAESPVSYIDHKYCAAVVSRLSEKIYVKLGHFHKGQLNLGGELKKRFNDKVKYVDVRPGCTATLYLNVLTAKTNKVLFENVKEGRFRVNRAKVSAVTCECAEEIWDGPDNAYAKLTKFDGKVAYLPIPKDYNAPVEKEKTGWNYNRLIHFKETNGFEDQVEYVTIRKGFRAIGYDTREYPHAPFIFEHLNSSETRTYKVYVDRGHPDGLSRIDVSKGFEYDMDKSKCASLINNKDKKIYVELKGGNEAKLDLVYSDHKKDFNDKVHFIDVRAGCKVTTYQNSLNTATDPVQKVLLSNVGEGRYDTSGSGVSAISCTC